MKIELKCIKECIVGRSMINDGQNLKIGDIIKTDISDLGLRFLINDCYSLPYRISDLENYFEVNYMVGDE